MKDKIVFISIICFLFLIIGIGSYKVLLKKQDEYNKIKKENYITNVKKYVVEKVKNKYKEEVRIYKDSYLYKLNEGNLEIAGIIYKNNIVKIEESKIDIDLEQSDFFYKITSLDEEYYIMYENITSYDSDNETDEFKTRYQKYIPFNENIETKDEVTFYKDGKKLYTLNKSLTLKVYIKENDYYGVEFNNELLEVKKEDVKSVVSASNSNKQIAKEVPVLLYHFIYDQSKESCNEIVCNSLSQVTSHINYMKNNSFFTVTMDEFEKFIDGKINLPKKSVLITVDDGGYAVNAKKLFTQNKINATLFMVSSWFKKEEFESDYFEIHSHTHNMHRNYVCNGGYQGGAILCTNHDELLNDFKTSRELTNNSVALAYPFYDYNSYAIGVAKEAGFRMGFGGYYEGGTLRMRIGGNKFKIPRYTILSDTSLANVRYYLG